jgi:TIR domain-containing protein
MSRMFVSYSREDQGLVRRLVEDIEALGHTPWFDEELSGGQVWWDEVLNQIRTCDVFVLAVSPATISSTACKREYGYADAVGKPILPVVVTEGISTNLLPPALSKIQLVPYLRPDRGEALRLARAVSSLPPARPLPNPLPPPPDVPISYLGQLTEKVESLSALDYDDQSALLIDLRRGIQDPETRDDSRTLLERLRKRRDLFAAIAEEIDLLPMAAARAVAPLGPAPPALPRPRGSVVLANAFVGVALVLLLPVWIGMSLDADDELSAAALMENLPLGLAISALFTVWVICSRGWANTQPVASERGGIGATLRSVLVLFRPTRPTGWVPIVSWHIGLVWLVVLVAKSFFDSEPLDEDTVIGLVFAAVVLVGYLTSARGWALSFRHGVRGDRVTAAGTSVKS